VKVPGANPSRYVLRCVLATALAMYASVGAHAQQTRDFSQPNSDRVIDWYFAATFGTGVYTIGDRTVLVARVPFSLQLRESDEHQWGVKLKLPVTLGVYRIPNQIDDVFNQDNFAALSVLPGIEFERQITSRWVLRPTMSFGYGHEFASTTGASIWEVGVRSAYTIPFREGEFVLGNALLYAGSNATGGTRQNLGIFSTGLNFIVPTGRELMGHATNFGLHLVHYAYFNQLDFFLDANDRRSVYQQFEIAFTVGAPQPFNIMGFSLDRAGVGFLFGQDFAAVRFVTGFVY
jgi:hypothetical protein